MKKAPREAHLIERINMEIFSFGVGERQAAASEYLKSAPGEFSDKRIILLPIPTTRDGKLITGTDIPLESVLSLVDNATLVAGYSIPHSLAEKIIERGASICDGAKDSDFLLENARLTAIGTVGVILTESKMAPEDMKIGVVGYGRIGKQLLRELLFLGASVTVFTEDDGSRLALSEQGVKTGSYNHEIDSSSFDLLINTAPRALDVSGDGQIYDLASGNYLEGLPRVKKLPSLPAKMFPLSAGKLYAKFIAKHI